ncbi:hypothetical protein CVT25_015399 [Psilocybe cyanescens]|uniref:Sugar phosphate transporter domain-containing protein n=1 Tax=Psilocybe cyanescens TaxID=93625 RepID=A0A409WHB8_PSICY|nr:hypothetical protein CVT25_015399 [Psilocybe cyanescens]
MSTPTATPTIVLTSIAEPTVPSTPSGHEDLERVDLVTPTTDGPNFTNQELALNGSIRPRSRATIPQINDAGLSSFGPGTYGKEEAQFHGSASFEGGPTTTKIRRKYHRDELSPTLYPLDDLSSRSESGSDLYDKESLPRMSPQSNPSSKIRVHLSRHASPILQVTRPFLIFPSRLRAIPDSPLLWLLLYFTLNLSLTLYNKTVLIHFPFPYTLTALHAFCGTIGTRILLRVKPSGGSQSTGARLTNAQPPQAQHPTVPNLNGKELIVLLLFSILYTINIVVSNASLRLVTVPFHQVVRASTPFFTITFAAALLGKRCSKKKLLSLVPVVIGVGFATYGDYYFTAFGFFLTLLGTVLASLKTILTNVILLKPSATGLPISSENSRTILDEKRAQSSFSPSFISSVSSHLVKRVFPHSSSSPSAYPIKPHSPTSSQFAFSLPKLSLSPIHLLYLLSPLAFIQTTLLAHFTGELDRVRWHLFDPATATAKYGSTAVNGRMWLILNGVLAFMLNMVSFNANRRVGALGMSVAANVKQVLTVLSAVVLFDLTITPANGLGILLTLIGGALYATVELQEKKEIKSRIG